MGKSRKLFGGALIITAVSTSTKKDRLRKKRERQNRKKGRK
jgi:hypothetical protein